jgi:VWFA-related protein
MRWRLGLIGLPMALAIMAVSAQTPQTPQTTSPPAQSPTFRAGVNHVQTDVKVFDKKHQIVSDMRPDEFQVYEDGVLQKLTEFVGQFGGRLIQPWSATTSVLTEGVMLPPPPPKEMGGRIFVVFIDDMHIQPNDSPKVKQILHQMAETMMHPDDLISIVSTGFSACESREPDHDLSHRKLQECIDKLMGSGSTPREILDMVATSQGLSELHHRMNTAFRTAYDILDQLEYVSGKTKAFIWISEGYDLNPFKQARLEHAQAMYDSEFGTPNQKQIAQAQANSDQSSSGGVAAPGVVGSTANAPIVAGQSLADPGLNPFGIVSGQFSEMDLVFQMAELIRAANRANTRIYTVDPRGLSAGPPLDVKISMDDWSNFLQTSISSLQVIAQQTGGFPGVNRNDFQKIFREIDNDSSDSYLIGWDSSNPDPLRRKRRIEIKLTRPGVEATAYKTEYTISPRKK